jgi:DNA-binding NarL/FixJ family response regulator
VIRVVLADDQRMVRAGLRSLLEQTGDVEVVGEAGDGEQAIAEVRAHAPDVVLMDVRMPVLDGIAATARIVASDEVATRVVVLTTFDLDDYVFRALRAGASGFLLKDAPVEDLVAALRVAARGDALLDPAVTRRVIEAFARAPEPPQLDGVDDLSPREHEVLALLATGASNAEIAAALVVSEATVKTHVSNVLVKLRLRDRVQAVIYAYESGVVRPGATPPGR